MPGAADLLISLAFRQRITQQDSFLTEKTNEVCPENHYRTVWLYGSASKLRLKH